MMGNVTSINIAKLPKVRGTYRFSEPLKKYTWLNVGGPAEIMFFPEDLNDLQYFLQNKSNDLPVFVIGGGSNLLVRDGGVAGVVIKLKNKNFSEIRAENEKIYIGAGLTSALLKEFLIKNELGNLEFVCSIPGTIGGLIRTNAGCFGQDVSQVLVHAKIIDGQGNIRIVSKDDFHFNYRTSNFPEDWIVIEVCLQASRKSATEIKRNIESNHQYRLLHQPHNIRTAGSTFKNPDGYKAWELIKKAGGCNLQIGGASFSEQHCNFLVNNGSATAEDIENLGNTVIKKVKELSNVNLEWEVRIVGNK